MIEIIPNWHPLFVHFTVALITVSGISFLLAKLIVNKKLGEELLITGCWTLWIGAFFTIATVLAGFFAYYSVEHDTPSHIAMTTHRNWALVTSIAILFCVGWSLIQYRKKIKPTIPFILAMLITLALLASTAWHGGELVYRYGIGVISLPQSSEAGHQHKHNENTEENNHHSKNKASKAIDQHDSHKH